MRCVRQLANPSSACVVAAAASVAASATSCADDASMAQRSNYERYREFDELVSQAKLTREIPVIERAKANGRVSLLWDTFLGPDKMEELRMWQQDMGPDNQEHECGEKDTVAGQTHTRVLIRLGGDLICGHPGIIHGGFTAAILDEMLGWASFAERDKVFGEGSGALIFTANLSVNYRKPMPAYRSYIIDVKVTRVVRRKKVYLTATWKDSEGNLYADATSLYIIKKGSQASAVDYGAGGSQKTE